MSQQYPEQPGYGPPQQAWGTPPPQPPKKKSTGKIIGLGCAGVLALFVIIGIFGAALGGGSDDSSKGTSVSSDSSAEETAPADDKPAVEEDAAVEETEEAPPEAPVKITAAKTAFAKSILAEGSNYTSVKVTVTNNGDETIDVNPLYFTITDTNGTKHTAELAADENQIDTVKLAPGENVSGSITGKGKFTAEYVTYIDGLLGEPIRSDVS
jgi:hypothetical protein